MWSHLEQGMELPFVAFDVLSDFGDHRILLEHTRKWITARSTGSSLVIVPWKPFKQNLGEPPNVRLSGIEVFR